jgi:hypothetical protein
MLPCVARVRHNENCPLLIILILLLLVHTDPRGTRLVRVEDMSSKDDI